MVNEKRYVPIDMPPISSSMTIEQAEFVVRNDNGETLVEGYVAIQTPRTVLDRKIVMSQKMAEEMIAKFLDDNGITVDSVRKAINELSKDYISEPPTMMDVFLEARVIDL